MDPLTSLLDPRPWAMEPPGAGSLEAKLAGAKQAKRQAGKQIKAWTAAFKRAHGGREPTLEEKEDIRETYVEYARATGILKAVKEAAAIQLQVEPRAPALVPAPDSAPVPTPSPASPITTPRASADVATPDAPFVRHERPGVAVEDRIERLRTESALSLTPVGDAALSEGRQSFLDDEVCAAPARPPLDGVSERMPTCAHGGAGE